MKKRIATLLLSVMMTLTALSGCAGDSAPAPEGSAPAGEKPKSDVTLSILASQDWVKDAEFTLGEKFTEETGIKVDYQIVPADQYPNLLMTKLNAGEGADIFMNQSGTFDLESQLQISKNAADLSGEEWVGRFQQAVKEQVTVGGKVYGITIWDQGDSYALVYNKKIFSDLGLEVPGSYEDFKKVCQTIKDAGITPVYECVSDGWHHVGSFIEVAGAYNAVAADMVEQLNDNKTTFSAQPVFETVLNQYKEVVDLGYWGEDYMSNEYANLGSEMASGNYAMAVNMMGRIDEILASDPELKAEDFGFFPYPYGDNKIIASTPCGPSKFIFSGSKNLDAAKQYLAFLARPENLQFMIDTEPSFNSMPFDGLTSTYSPEITAAMDKYKDDSAAVYQNVVKYLNPQWMDVGKDLTSLILGEMDAKEVLAAMDKRRVDQATAAGDANWQK